MLIQKEPFYSIESYFRGDPTDSVGKRCHFRRYVTDVYLEGAIADSGCFKLHHGGELFYYLGNLPQNGIDAKIEFDISRKRGGAEIFKTKNVEVVWTSDAPIDARNERKKIATLLFCFRQWGMEYSEIESHDSRELISPAADHTAKAGELCAKIGENNYLGTVIPDSTPPKIPECPENIEKGAFLSRFVLMSDSHIGPTYHKEEYGWLDKIDAHLKDVHANAPIDFLVQLGDNIDDGYVKNYERDYAIYLEQIKRITLCDPENPIDGRKKGTIPHYEMQGNHDTSLDTRFFRNRLWYTENENGKVAYIAFFTSYGGYPLVNYDTCGSYESYRSYGVISEETVAFVERSIKEAKENGAKHIILLSHFGISQELNAPILPESGLGKVAALCEKYGITLFFNGHEHNSDFTHRMYKNIHDFDLATSYFKYAVAELYENVCELRIYDTEKQELYRKDLVALCY